MGSHMDFDELIDAIRELDKGDVMLRTAEQLSWTLNKPQADVKRALPFARPESTEKSKYPRPPWRLADYVRHCSRKVEEIGGGLSEHLAALAELARGMAREGYVTQVIAHPHLGDQCGVCDSASNVLPQRIAVRDRQFVMLLCDSCQRKLHTPQLKGSLVKAIRKVMREQVFEQVMLVKTGSRVRMVSGVDLDTEVLA